MNKAPNPKFFDEYTQWLQLQGLTQGTINNYLYLLAKIPHEVDHYFANRNLKGRKMKIYTYRSYLKFLCKKKKKLLSRGDLLDALDTSKNIQKRGNGQSNRKWSVPRKLWGEYIRHAPNKVAKMGIWLGFQFGLRLGEILHLRIQDIDFNRQEIQIHEHKKRKTGSFH
jgi:integrase